MPFSASPFLRMIDDTGTLYAFPSAAEDIGNTFSDDRKFRFSKFACLRIPDIRTGTGAENYLKLDAVPGAYTRVTTADWNVHFGEFLQDYVMNLETMLRSSDSYDPDEPRTVSERVFWKALKEAGGMRWRLADPTERGPAAGPRYVEEDESDHYKRVVQYVGTVDIVNSVSATANAFTEVHLYIPHGAGHTPSPLFYTVSDGNYSPGMIITHRPADPLDAEYIAGRKPDDATAGLDHRAEFDSDVSSYSAPDYELWRKSTAGEWETGWRFSNPVANSYITDPSFTDAANDDLRIVGTGSKGTTLTFRRSRLDGVGLDTDLTSYPLYTGQASPGDWATYNSGPASSHFEFNAVLLYYDVLDANGDIVETNPYGIFFLEDWENDSQGAGYIPRTQKYKTNTSTGQTGLGWSYTLCLKFDVNAQDAAVETAVNEYSAWSMQAYAEALSLMMRVGDTVDGLAAAQADVARRQQMVEEQGAAGELISEVSARVAAIEESLQAANDFYADRQAFLDLVQGLRRDLTALLQGQAPLALTVDLNAVRGGPGVTVDRSARNRLVLDTAYRGLALGDAPVVRVADWEERPTQRRLTAALQPGPGYLRVEEPGGASVALDRDLCLYIDDSTHAWQRGQTVRISFATPVDAGARSLRIYTDARDSAGSGQTYSVLAATVTPEWFAGSGGTPMAEVICVSADMAHPDFRVEKIR